MAHAIKFRNEFFNATLKYFLHEHLQLSCAVKRHYFNFRYLFNHRLLEICDGNARLLENFFFYSLSGIPWQPWLNRKIRIWSSITLKSSTTLSFFVVHVSTALSLKFWVVYITFSSWYSITFERFGTIPFGTSFYKNINFRG